MKQGRDRVDRPWCHLGDGGELDRMMILVRGSPECRGHSLMGRPPMSLAYGHVEVCVELSEGSPSEKAWEWEGEFERAEEEEDSGRDGKIS